METFLIFICLAQTPPTDEQRSIEGFSQVNCTNNIPCQFVGSDGALYHKTYDLHVLALQKPFIESEGQSPKFISFRALAQVKAEPRRAWSEEGGNRSIDGPYAAAASPGLRPGSFCALNFGCFHHWTCERIARASGPVILR